MDRGAWHAAVQRVAKSWTRMSMHAHSSIQNTVKVYSLLRKMDMKLTSQPMRMLLFQSQKHY